jgi:VanZ family protein
LHSWPKDLNRFVFRDIVVNVALYVPAGVTGHLAFRKSGKMWPGIFAPLVVCTLVSAAIELIQLYVPSRDTSLLDLATNVAGAASGVFLGVVAEDVFLESRALADVERKTARQPDRVALGLLGCWLVWLTFPLFPVLGRTVLGYKLRVFLASPLGDPVPLLSAFAAWFLAGNLLVAVALPPARKLIAVLTLLIPTQLFIVDRQPAMSEFAGAVAGACCFAILRGWRRGHRKAWWRATASFFLAVILVRGMAPFQFSGAGVNSFSWIPFSGFLKMNWQNGVGVFAEKSFWYGGAIWLLRAAGMRLRDSTAAVAAILLAIEAAQTHLAGRVAEITDPLWAVFAGCAMAIVYSRRVRAD